MPPHPCVFVNEPKLLDLKMILIRQHGLKAEFVGGVLTCEDTVAIKRVGLFKKIKIFSKNFSCF
jgi:hypothetical protein